jgi:Holliday junction resolvase RusA-like endonuclease
MFPGRLLNLNYQRGQTRFMARATAEWKFLGATLARQQFLPRPIDPPVRVVAEFTFPDHHRRDSGNLYPTVKALVDGIVKAGCLADDCDGMVEGPWIRRSYPNGPLGLLLSIYPVTDDDLARPIDWGAVTGGER